jgi:hypothetical protein
MVGGANIGSVAGLGASRKDEGPRRLREGRLEIDQKVEARYAYNNLSKSIPVSTGETICRGQV